MLNKTLPREAERDEALVELPGVPVREGWRFAAQVAIVGLFILALGVVLNLARSLLRPVVAALIIAVMLGPLSRRAAQYRVPPALFAVFVVGVIVAALHLVTIAVSDPVEHVIAQLPTLGPRIAQKFQIFEPAVAALHNLQSMLAPGGDSGLRVDIPAVLQSSVFYLTPALGEVLVFLATLFLALVGREQLRESLIMLFSGRERRLAAIHVINDVETKLTQYIGTVTAINFVIGLVVAIISWGVGLPGPLLFGLLAFVCNFVSYIGPATTAVSLLVGGLFAFPSLTSALLAPAIFLGVSALEGQVITPSLVGRRFTVNPLAVFLSLVFWLWLWGPIGGVLSVPILIIGYAVFSHLWARREPELPG